MADALRGAVIGVGIVARLRHIPAFQEAARRGTAELVAICDPVPTALNEAGDQAGIGDAVSGLSRGAGARRHRRHYHRDAELVARADRGRGVAGWQARPLREAPALSLDGARRMAAAARPLTV